MKYWIIIGMIGLVGCAEKIQSPTGKIAPSPRMKVVTALAPVQVVGPQDNVAVGWTENADWNKNHWYLIYINGIQQPFGGTPILQSNNPTGKDWQTPNKIYNFPIGNHTLEVKLVNHCEIGDTDPLCQNLPGTPCSPTISDPCSEATGITVISQVEVPQLPIPPTITISVSQCKFVIASNPPDTTTGWSAQFKNGDVNIGTVDSISPFTRTASFKLGVYNITVTWSKTGAIPVTSQVTIAECK
jgi:hypothetical protein